MPSPNSGLHTHWMGRRPSSYCYQSCGGRGSGWRRGSDGGESVWGARAERGEYVQLNFPIPCSELIIPIKYAGYAAPNSPRRRLYRLRYDCTLRPRPLCGDEKVHRPVCRRDPQSRCAGLKCNLEVYLSAQQLRFSLPEHRLEGRTIMRAT